MRRVTLPLSRMGARIDTEAGGLPPLRIHGGATLVGIDTTLEVASAQVKSALLLAGMPSSVPGITVNRLCASGLDAVIAGARAIATT